MSGVVAFWHNPNDLLGWIAVIAAYALVVAVLALPVIVVVRYARRTRSSDDGDVRS